MRTIPWRTDGYRLFDISVLSGANPFGYLHPLMESNCMFAPANSTPSAALTNASTFPAVGAQPAYVPGVARTEHATHPDARGGFVSPVPRRRDHPPGQRTRRPDGSSTPVPGDQGSGLLRAAPEPSSSAPSPTALPVMAYSAVEAAPTTRPGPRGGTSAGALRRRRHHSGAGYPRHLPSYGPYGSTTENSDVHLPYRHRSDGFEPKHIVFST